MASTLFRIGILFVFLISGCTNTPDRPTKPAQALSQPTPDSGDPQHLIDLADDMPTSAYGSALYLKAASLLFQKGRKAEAAVVLEQVSPRRLDPEKLRQYLQLGFQLSLDQKNLSLAQRLLEFSELADFSLTSPDERIHLNQLKADTLALTGHHFEAALIRIENANLLEGDAYLENIEKIWRELRQTPVPELENFTPLSTSQELSGWIELALVLRNNLFSLDDQIAALKVWQGKWADHPAARHLPGELALMIRLPELRPRRITLALPLSGHLEDAGQAILQGFLQSFYNDSIHQDDEFQLSLVDTGQTPAEEIAFAIEQTVPDLVIGPLQRNMVDQLKGDYSYLHRTLALNYAALTTQDDKEFFEFGLSYDDEIRQITQRMQRQGQHRMLLFCPADTWGKRTCAQVKAHWTEMNGVMVDETYYNPRGEHTRIVEASLKVNESKARKYELQTILGRQVEFEPVRRQDVDAIFLIADPVNGRQIRPLITFYYAGDLPVYALSRIYSGESDPLRDQDLDGVLFTEIPWILQQSNPLKTELTSFWPQLAKNYNRLFALGADAYLLAPRLPLIEQLPDTHINGHAGALFSPDGRRINRLLDWATFVAGRPRVVTAN